MIATEQQLCPICDGEGRLPDTGKQADGFRICDDCKGKGYVIVKEIDKNHKVKLP